MGDLVSNFCAAFALLGAKLLYWNAQPVTIGSVLLTILISGAVSHLFTGAAAATSVQDYYKVAVDSACAYKDLLPLFLQSACHTVNTPGPSSPPSRFGEN